MAEDLKPFVEFVRPNGEKLTKEKVAQLLEQSLVDAFFNTALFTRDMAYSQHEQYRRSRGVPPLRFVMPESAACAATPDRGKENHEQVRR